MVGRVDHLCKDTPTGGHDSKMKRHCPSTPKSSRRDTPSVNQWTSETGHQTKFVVVTRTIRGERSYGSPFGHVKGVENKDWYQTLETLPYSLTPCQFVPLSRSSLSEKFTGRV